MSASGEPAEKTEKPSPNLGPVIKNVDVFVSNIDVVVTDSKGKRVTGLRKEDFEVIEDGLLQNLTNFYAVEDGAYTVIGDEAVPPPSVAPAGVPKPAASEAPIPVQRTRIIVFIDNLHLTPFNRNRVLRNVQDFLRSALKENVEAMVVTWNRSLKVRRKFTSDGRDLADVLKQIEEESALGLTTISERRDLLQQIDEADNIDQAMGRARSYAQSLENDLKFTFDALKTTMTQLAGVDGRKILVHVSEGLPQSPGAEIWQYVQDRFRSTGGSLLNAFEFDRTSAYLSVIQSANAAGVTIYTIDASGLSVDSGVTAENRSTTARINTFIERQNLQSMLVSMAEETGGTAILNKNDVTLALKDLEKDFSSYYSLGYRSLRSGADRPHAVEVKVKRKGLTARARRSYLEKSPETRVTEAVLSALVFPRDENPLSVGVEIGRPAPADTQNYLVPVRLRIPFARLALLPEGKKLRGRVVFYFVVLDSVGSQSDLATQTAPVEIDAKAVDAIAKQDFIYDSKLLMIPGGQRLSIAVRDDITNTVSYIQKSVFVSALPPEVKSPTAK